jgi:hypothetical protein
MALIASDLFSQQSVSDSDIKDFWQSSIVPIMNKDEKQLQEIVHFPLEGDWGYVVGIEKPGKELAKADFFSNIDELFHKDFLERLKKMNSDQVEKVRTSSGEVKLMVGVNWENWIDGFKDESGMILRFRKVDQKWRLYMIQGVG